MTHVLAMLLLCLFAASLAPELSFRSVRARSGMLRVMHAAGRSVIALAPLLLGCVWCIAVYVEQYEWDPVMYKDPVLEGTAPPLWEKLAYFFSWATGVHSDFTDQVLVAAAMVTCVVAAGFGVRQLRRGEGWDGDAAPCSAPLVVPFVATFGAFLLTPMVFIGTHLIFPRLTQAVVIAAILAAPRITGRSWPRLRFTALAIGTIAGINLVAHAAMYAYETNDASRVIDDLPEGRRATAVIWRSDTFAFRHGTLTHLAAYYAARKNGDWSFSFARYLSVPVRFRPAMGPPWPLRGWEFAPQDYNPRCKFARTFDLALIRAPTGLAEESEVRQLVFGDDADAVQLLSHHGDYWAFDTAGLPDDGTF
jgi:hypothetical protein